MLNAAKKTNIYKELYHLRVGSDPLPDTLLSSFDLVIASGLFLPGHFEAENDIDEAIACVKVGGIFISAVQDQFWKLSGTELHEGKDPFGFRDKF